MLNTTQIDTIRHMDKQGVPRRQIAETLNISRNTVLKYADMDDFNTTESEVKAKGSISDLCKPIINKILTEDEKRWTKQRYTASCIYETLNNLMDVKKATQLRSFLYCTISL